LVILLMGSSDCSPLTFVSQVSGITGVNYHTGPGFCLGGNSHEYIEYIFFKMLQNQFLLQSHFWVFTQIKLCSHKNLCTDALFVIAKNQEQPMCLPTGDWMNFGTFIPWDTI
jgi:hypothetical protein